jgi:2,4-dienoyl-CoA reductase-like NADH-dependent reductase (Old Yellow Enzyme family)
MRQLAELKGSPLESLQGDRVLHHLRKFYTGNLILNADISPDHGEQLLQEGLGVMIAFVRLYIANPDCLHVFRRTVPSTRSDRTVTTEPRRTATRIIRH